MATDVAAHPVPPHAHRAHHSQSTFGDFPAAGFQAAGDQFKGFPNNSNNISPPSPRDPFAPNCGRPAQPSRQIQQPRAPLYIPAVLRRTEKPFRNSPPKDTATLHSRHHSISSDVFEGMFDGGISRVMSGELNDDGHGPVTGPPTRNHWKPDNAVNTCSAPVCRKPFNFFLRRHHCRRCGGIFCWEHSNNEARLNQHGLFHSEAQTYRVCDRCYGGYETWKARRSSRSNSEGSIVSDQSSQGSSVSSSTALPIPTTNAHPDPSLQVGSIAKSCLYDHFSTF